MRNSIRFICTSHFVSIRFGVTKLIPWSRVLLQEPVVVRLVKKYLAFYGIRTSITYAQDITSGLFSKPYESSVQKQLFRA